MNRAELIRDHFEIMRDLAWIEDIEPKIKALDMDVLTLKRLRGEWNAHAERGNWEWCQNEAAGYSDAELTQMRPVRVEQLRRAGASENRRMTEYQHDR